MSAAAARGFAREKGGTVTVILFTRKTRAPDQAIRYTDAAQIMTNKRKLHEAVIATTVRSNKIKSKSRVDALSSGQGEADAEAQDEEGSDGGIDGVTISDMFGDETSGKGSSGKSYAGYRSGGVKKKTRKHREDASDFIIPSRPSAAAAAAGGCLLRVHSI